MANIKLKNINDLHTWNTKELRKLKMTTNNRISTLSSASKPKDLPSTHPLHEMELGECKELLLKIARAEKSPR